VLRAESSIRSDSVDRAFSARSSQEIDQMEDAVYNFSNQAALPLKP
jgi:hypothetical protein